MEQSRCIIHLFTVVLLIASISCQDSTSPAPADGDAETPKPVARFTTPPPAGAAPAAGADDVATQAPAGGGDDGDDCGTVSSEVDLCNTNLDSAEATCETLKEYDACVEKSLEDCTDEGILTQVKENADAKKAEKAVDCQDAAVPETGDDKAVVTTEPPPTTEPTTTQPPLPACEDPIAKAGEVQKCNDVIEQDSLCIQIQKAVDCVEKRADCSEEKFDQEVDNYLASFENYAQDYQCIITYQGKRLEQRHKPGQAAQSQAQSGSSFVTINLFSSFAVICAGLLLSR